MTQNAKPAAVRQTQELRQLSWIVATGGPPQALQHEGQNGGLHVVYLDAIDARRDTCPAG
jgi:hypothetical protein